MKYRKQILNLIACLLFLEAGEARAEALDVTVVTLEGEEQPEKLVGVADTGFKFERGNVPFEGIAEVRFAGTDAAPGAAALYLRNGDQLRAAILSGDDTKLKVKSSLGDLEIENQYLDGIVFGIKDGPAPEVVDAFIRGAGPKEDLLLLSKGDTLNGFMEKFSDKELTFNVGGQSRAYAFDQIAAFRLAPLKEFKSSTEFRATVMLHDGSLLTGKLVSLDAKALVFEALDGQKWSAETSNLSSILFKGGKLVYLSDLKPKTAEEKPYAGGAPLVYPWRRDQAVTGEKLNLAGKTHARGIGVHSYCKLVYDLDGEYAKFMSDVGLQIGAAPNAVCAWKVAADGKEVAAGTAKAGDKAQTVKLEIKGARQLELICDYGPDDDDAGDQFNWASARLIKP